MLRVSEGQVAPFPHSTPRLLSSLTERKKSKPKKLQPFLRLEANIRMFLLMPHLSREYLCVSKKHAEGLQPSHDIIFFVTEHQDATSASFNVSYESPEYSRLFGATPLRNIKRFPGRCFGLALGRKRMRFPSAASQKMMNPQQAQLTGDSLIFLYKTSGPKKAKLYQWLR